MPLLIFIRIKVLPRNSLSFLKTHINNLGGPMFIQETSHNVPTGHSSDSRQPITFKTVSTVTVTSALAQNEPPFS